MKPVELFAISLVMAIGTTGCSRGVPVTISSTGEQVSTTATPTSIGEVDHAAWNALAGKYVDAQGYVDYAGWKGSQSDQAALGSYLQTLSQTKLEETSPRAIRLAFWINAYNALTIRAILNEYPTTSIKNHVSYIPGGYNIWDDFKLEVDGKEYSLNQIEHKVIRPLGEPRIHIALVCASIGCPILLNEAYTAERLESQLDMNARAFFADKTNFRYDAGSNRMWLSQIFEWYGEDFGKTPAEQLRTIAPYLPDESSRRAAEGGQVEISYLEYDWGLNDQQSRN